MNDSRTFKSNGNTSKGGYGDRNSGDERFENEDDNDYDNIDRDEDANFQDEYRDYMDDVENES
jgi:hypothetical protein